MSRVFSFRDLKRVPSLTGFSETELLNPKHDAAVNEVLAAVGFNIQAPILYVPSRHRDLAGKVEVGFRAVGEISNDPVYLNSKLCPLIERLIWASQKDPSLARELSKMMGHSVNLDEDAADEVNDFPDSDIDPDYGIIQMQIEALTFYRDEVRGSPYNEQGNLKTPAEYQTT
jgi:hypothetical protein